MPVICKVSAFLPAAVCMLPALREQPRCDGVPAMIRVGRLSNSRAPTFGNAIFNIGLFRGYPPVPQVRACCHGAAFFLLKRGQRQQKNAMTP